MENYELDFILQNDDGSSLFTLIKLLSCKFFYLILNVLEVFVAFEFGAQDWEVW
jgi:hypothetical protein